MKPTRATECTSANHCACTLSSRCYTWWVYCRGRGGKTRASAKKIGYHEVRPSCAELPEKLYSESDRGVPLPVLLWLHSLVGEEEMAQGAGEGAGDGTGGEKPLQQGQEEETNLSISEVKRTEPLHSSGSGDAPAGVIEAGAGGREGTVRTPSERGGGEAMGSSPLKTDAELSPTGRRSPFHDEVGEGELLSDFADGEHNWDTIPNEPASPALRGVHRIAVEVMRRSFGSADGDPGTCRGSERISGLADSPREGYTLKAPQSTPTKYIGVVHSRENSCSELPCQALRIFHDVYFPHAYDIHMAFWGWFACDTIRLLWSCWQAKLAL